MAERGRQRTGEEVQRRVDAALLAVRLQRAGAVVREWGCRESQTGSRDLSFSSGRG